MPDVNASLRISIGVKANQALPFISSARNLTAKDCKHAGNEAGGPFSLQKIKHG